MQLTLTVAKTGDIVTVDVSDDMSLADFKAYVSAETGVDSAKQQLRLDNKLIPDEDEKSLASLGIKADDLIVVSEKAGAASSSLATNTATSANTAKSVTIDPQLESIRQQLLNDPSLRSQFPPGVDAVLNDPQTFKTFVEKQANVARQPQIQGDPDDPDNQKRILEMIQQKEIEESMLNAIEYSPESFASVTMLYVSLELNGHPIKAFVDSGAQQTIISTNLAEECGLTRWIDKRFRGTAVGVGTSQIEGRIHNASIKLGGRFFPSSLTVLDNQVDFLLGLDMLKRHQGVIDLKHNQLILGDAKTSFLPESEIPKSIFTEAQSKPGPSSALGGNIFNIENLQPPKKQKLESSAAASTGSAAISAGSAAISRASTSRKYPQETINQLAALGFTEDQVIKALDATSGNVELAASYLFQ